MICAQCNHENAAGDKFCEQCGAPLESPSASGQVEDMGATMLGGPPQSVVLIRTDDTTQTFPLGNRVVVGRLDSCDIPIHDKSVSREHARLSQLPGGYVVEDLGSTNGTLVNGERVVDAVILRAGDSVTFGSIEFQFEEESVGQTSTPTSPSAQTQPFTYHPPVESGDEHQRAPLVESGSTSDASAQNTGVPVFEFPPLQPFATQEPSDTGADIPKPLEQSSATSDAASPWVATPAPDVPQNQQTFPSNASRQPDAPPESPLASIPARSPAPASERVEPGDSEAPGSAAEEALAVAAHLSDLVHSLARQLNDRDGERERMQERLHGLESASSAHGAVVRMLQDVPPPSMPSQQLQETQDALDQLIQNPRDIEVLMQLGRQATDLAAIVNEYGQLRRLLQRLQTAAEGT